MKFIVSSSYLLKNLSGLSGVLSSSTALPILECFLFDLSKSELKVFGSDLETSMNIQLKVESKDSGSVAIPARMLLDVLKTFPDQPLTFSVDDKKNSIEIVSDYGKYKLVGHPAEDFPKMVALDSPSSFEIDTSILSRVISKTLFAVGTDELRPVMTGVFVKIEKDGLTFVSTDAHKLVKYKIKDIKSKEENSYIIPKKTFSLLRSVISSGPVKVEYNNVNVSFTNNDIQITSKLIEGKYPNYDAVIPVNHPNLLTVDRIEFLNSIRRVSVFSNKNTHQIKLTPLKTKLNIEAEDLDFSNEAKEDMKCAYKGVELEIAFNSKFLQEILSSLEDEEVMIELGESNKAGVVKPVKSEEEVLMLLMPVMLNK